MLDSGADNGKEIHRIVCLSAKRDWLSEVVLRGQRARNEVNAE